MKLLAFAGSNSSKSINKKLVSWVSRIPGRSVFADKSIFLMATSPGRRGGSTALAIWQYSQGVT